jgi:hypothetical protein
MLIMVTAETSVKTQIETRSNGSRLRAFGSPAAGILLGCALSVPIWTMLLRLV